MFGFWDPHLTEKSLHDKHASSICLFFSERSWPRKQTASSKTNKPSNKRCIHSFVYATFFLPYFSILCYLYPINCYLCFPLFFISSCASFFPKNSLVGFIPTSCIHVILLVFPSLSLNSIWFHPSGFILLLFPTFSFWLPASLPPAAGGRFRGPGGDDLTVDGAQQQHEPDGSEHLGGRYPMRLWDSHIQDCCCHCEGEKEKVSRLWFKHSWRIPLHLYTDF